jgi:hypothetical protein
MPFLEHLVKKGLITEAQIPEINRIAIEKYQGDQDKALTDFKIDSLQLLAIKGAYFNMPVRNIDVKGIDPAILNIYHSTRQICTSLLQSDLSMVYLK